MSDDTTIDQTEIYQNYPGKWVALKDDEQTVVAANELAVKALKKAKEAGERNPILFKVPRESLPYIGLIDYPNEV